MFVKINKKFFLINNKQKIFLDISSKYQNLTYQVDANKFILKKNYNSIEFDEEIIHVDYPTEIITKLFIDSHKIRYYLEFNLKYFTKILYCKKINYKKCSLCKNNSVRRPRIQTCRCRPLNKFIFDAQKNDYIEFDNTYYRITKIHYKSHGSLKEAVKIVSIAKNSIKQNNMFQDNWVVCYDFETIKNVDNVHEPYILSYQLFSNNYIMQNFLFDPQIITTDPFLDFKIDISKKFVDTIINDYDCIFNLINGFDGRNQDYRDYDSVITCKQLILFGFNNYRFDDNFLLRHFVDQHFQITKSERNGVVSNIVLECPKTKIKIIIKDLIKWVPDMTLNQACEDYGTETSKLDVNIVTYNEMCFTQKRLIKTIDFNIFNDKLLKKPLSFTEKRKFLKSDFCLNNKEVLIYNYIVYYCKIDVVATMSLFLKINHGFLTIYRKFSHDYGVKLRSLNILDYISPAFVMSQIYKQIFNKKNIKMIQFKDKLFLDFICDSYFGGKVDFGLIGHYESKDVDDICYMDVSSMYPTVMTSNLPVIYDLNDFVYAFDVDEWQKLIDETIEARNLSFNDRTLFEYKWLHKFNDKKAILMCDLISPHVDDQIPIAPFPERGDDKLIYSYRDKYNVSVNTSDLKNLILCGFKVKVKFCKYNIEFLKNEKYFKELLDILDAFKDSAKSSGNKAEAKLIKLLSNSISGKLGQKITSRITNYKNFSSEEFDEQSITTSMHYIATFITAESRFILFRTIYNLYEHCLYNRLTCYQKLGIFILCDTDSIVFDAKNASKLNFIVQDGYGHWDNEKNDYIVHWKQKHSKDKVKSIFVLGRKSYVVCDKNNNVVKRVLKGIHSELMSLITFDDFKLISDNSPKTMHKTSLSRKTLYHEHGEKKFYKEIMEENIKKSLSLSYNKDNELVDFEKFEFENSYLFTLCKNNLTKTEYKDLCKNSLVFIWNK